VLVVDQTYAICLIRCAIEKCEAVRCSQGTPTQATPKAAPRIRKGKKAVSKADSDSDREEDEENVPPYEPQLPPDVSDLSSSDSEDDTDEGKDGDAPRTQVLAKPLNFTQVQLTAMVRALQRTTHLHGILPSYHLH
jgi:hypothetical protein